METLRTLKRDFPDLLWLNSTLDRGMTAAERHAWQPLATQALLDLLAVHDRRVVNSAVQLLEVVQESINRMMSELRNEHLPQVNFLWNEWTEGEKHRWKPKMEEHLSDWVAAFLQRDLKGRGIIVNRETQISRGEFTDILVSAEQKSQSVLQAERIDVIIEVKGSWHGEIRTAMQTQLVKTYLRERKTNVGLFLVGWFYSPGFDDRKPAGIKSMPELQIQLDAQAKDLTKDPLRVEGRVIDLRPILNLSSKLKHPAGKRSSPSHAASTKAKKMPDA